MPVKTNEHIAILQEKAHALLDRTSGRINDRIPFASMKWLMESEKSCAEFLDHYAYIYSFEDSEGCPKTLLKVGGCFGSALRSVKSLKYQCKWKIKANSAPNILH
jgi:hypothetical protein